MQILPRANGRGFHRELSRRVARGCAQHVKFDLCAGLSIPRVLPTARNANKPALVRHSSFATLLSLLAPRRAALATAIELLAEEIQFARRHRQRQRLLADEQGSSLQRPGRRQDVPAECSSGTSVIWSATPASALRGLLLCKGRAHHFEDIRADQDAIADL